MHWDTGQMFEILATGDGYFMYKVLQAISMLWSSGVFNGLGAMGLLLGLLLTGMQTVSSGGQKMDIGSLFTGFLLWAVLFAGGASVQVTEVGYTRPGQGGKSSYVIDNVPFGLAVGGWVISNVGKKMTEVIEQSFGLLDEGNSVLATGPGRSLDWLASIRMAGNINVGSNDNQFATMRGNLMNYIQICSAQGVIRNPNKAATLAYETDILSSLKGIGFESNLVTMPWLTYVNAGSPPTSAEKTCTQATAALRAYFVDGESAIQDYAALVASPKGYGGSISPADQMRNAAQAVNLSLDQMQKYMLGSTVASLWDQSLAGSALLTPEQVASNVMITQALQQRATQYAAEESMFKRSMFPLMSFLECLLYIAAPFVALALGLGRAGIGIAGKYAMTSLWVVLWMPTMAVVNFFQVTSFQRSMEYMQLNIATGLIPYGFGSVASAAHIQENVMEWVSVGSLLSASVPMIALVLLTGSAYSMTSLAGAFKGGDFVNEKMTSPDIATNPAALGRASMMSHDLASGTTMTGATQGMMSFNQQRGIGESSGITAARADMQQWSHGMGKQLANEVAFQTLAGVRGSQQWSERSDQTAERAYQALKASGVDFGTANMTGIKSAMQFSEAVGADGSVSPLALTGLKQSLAAGAAKAEKAVAGGGSSFLRNAMDAVGARFYAGMKQEDMVQSIADNTSRLASTISAKTSQSEALRASVTGSNVASAEEHASITGSNTQKVANTDDLRKVAQASETMTNAYATNQTWNAGVGSGIQIGSAELAGRIARADSPNGVANEAKTAARMTAVAQSFGISEETMKQATQANMAWAGNADQARIAAVAGLLNGDAPGVTTNDKLGTSEQRAALTQELTRAGIMGGGAGNGAVRALGNNSQAAAGVAAGAVDAGQGAQTRVEGGGVGVGNPSGFEASTRANAGSMQTPGGRQAALARVSGFGIPVGRAMAGGGRGLAMNGGNGQVNASAADAAGAPTLAVGHAQEAAVYGQGKAAQAPTNQQHSDQNMANDNMLLNRGGSGATHSIGQYGGYPMEGTLKGEYGAAGAPNPHVATHSANIAAGLLTNGSPVNSDAATVMGSVLGLGSNGGPLSPAQGAARDAALGRLSPGMKTAVNQVLNAFDGDGKFHPDRVPAGAVATLTSGPLQHGAPAPNAPLTGSPSAIPSKPYTSYKPGEDNFMEHVNFRAEGGHSPYEYSVQKHERAERSGLPIQGQNGHPVGPWQKGWDDHDAAKRAASKR